MGTRLDIAERKMLKEELENHYAAMFDQFKKYDDIYNTNFTFKLPKNVTPIKVPIGRDAVESCTDQIATSSIRIFVPPRSPKKQKEADRLEKFYLGAWHTLNRYHDYLRDAAKHGIHYGKFCFKPLWDMSALNNPFILPLTLRVIHPRNIMEDPASFVPRYAIEIKHLKLGQVMQLEIAKDNDWVPPTTGKNGRILTPMSDVEIVEYWDDEYWAIDCEGIELKPLTEHALGAIPYVIRTTGFGMESEEGKPEERVRGLLHDMDSLVASVSRNWSYMESLMMWAASPLVFIKTENEEEFKKRFSMAPGEENYLGPTDEVTFPKVPDVTPELLRERNAIMYQFDRQTAPAVIRGERPTGVSAGYTVAVLAGQARLKFGATQKALNEAVSLVNERLAVIVEKVIQEPITVWAKTPQGMIDEVIKPSDIDGHYTNFVEIEPVNPEEEERKIRIGLEIKASKLPVSDRQIMEQFLGMPNATEVQTDYLVEQALNSPEMVALRAQIALEEYGYSQMQRQAQEQAQALMRAPPGGEAPGEMMTQFPHQAGGMGGQMPQPVPERVMPGSQQEIGLTQRQMGRWRAPRPNEPLPRTFRQGLR